MCLNSVGVFRFPSHWFWGCFVRRNHNVERKMDHARSRFLSSDAASFAKTSRGHEVQFLSRTPKGFPTRKKLSFPRDQSYHTQEKSAIQKASRKIQHSCTSKALPEIFQVKQLSESYFFTHLCEKSEKSSIRHDKLCVFKRQQNGVIFVRHSNGRRKPTTNREPTSKSGKPYPKSLVGFFSTAKLKPSIF